MDTTNILNSIKNISEVINIKENKDEVIKHSRDWRGRINNNALCVVFPKSNNDVSKLLKFANANNLKVIPQGGNTSLVAGSSPTENEKEILINLKKMDKIIEIDNFNKCAVVEAGVIVDNLSDELNKIGKHFPVEMASTGSSQVGGIISTNAGGINVLRYGSVRQNILGLEVVTANGEILNLGSKVVKDNTGYNLKDLFCGSEGTLGIITKAILKIYPKPKDHIHFIMSFNSITNVLETFEKINNDYSGYIEGFEFIPHLSFELCIKHKLLDRNFFNKNYPYYALVKIVVNEGKDIILENFQNKMMSNDNLFEDLIIAQNIQESNNFWQFREKLTEAQKLDGKLLGFDISIPLDHLDSFFEKSKSLINEIVPGVKFHTFGHLGDSNIHYNLIQPDNFNGNFFDCENDIKKIINPLLKKYHGSISAEHGIGILKKDDFYETKSKEEILIMKKIKSLFDPKNILNNKKIFD